MQPISKSQYHSGTRYDYTLNGRLLIRVTPKNRAAEPCPWVWRAEFFDAFPAVDIALLEKGYEIIYYCLSDMYGCPEAVKQMKLAHDTVVKEFDLEQKAVILGFSRGGLYACNYSLSYPEDISLIYLDAPVLDTRSWPLCLVGKNVRRKNDCLKEAKQCLECYGFKDESDAMAYDKNPIDRLSELTRFPILLIAGAADTVVPFDENGQKLFDAMQGHDIKLILKPGCEHWPHSVDHPAEAVEYITTNRIK